MNTAANILAGIFSGALIGYCWITADDQRFDRVTHWFKKRRHRP